MPGHVGLRLGDFALKVGNQRLPVGGVVFQLAPEGLGAVDAAQLFLPLGLQGGLAGLGLGQLFAEGVGLLQCLALAHRRLLGLLVELACPLLGGLGRLLRVGDAVFIVADAAAQALLLGLHVLAALV